MAGEADAPAVGLSGLTEGQREQAMTRWRLLAPHVEAACRWRGSQSIAGSVSGRCSAGRPGTGRPDWPGWPEPDELTGDSGGFPPICGC
jgi:hypothetical protein